MGDGDVRRTEDGGEVEDEVSEEEGKGSCCMGKILACVCSFLDRPAKLEGAGCGPWKHQAEFAKS